jgi:hypothetical protein
MVYKPRMRREPNGRASRARRLELEPLSSPAEVRRLRDQALRGTQLAAWGTTLGWLYLDGKLTEAQFAAGNRWAQLTRDYEMAQQAPRPPGTVQLERSHGVQLDPDSEDGRKEARRHRQALLEYVGGVTMLDLASSSSRRVLSNVVIENLLPVGKAELTELGTALSVLATWFASGRRRK